MCRKPHALFNAQTLSSGNCLYFWTRAPHALYALGSLSHVLALCLVHSRSWDGGRDAVIPVLSVPLLYHLVPACPFSLPTLGLLNAGRLPCRHTGRAFPGCHGLRDHFESQPHSPTPRRGMPRGPKAPHPPRHGEDPLLMLICLLLSEQGCLCPQSSWGLTKILGKRSF